MIEGERRQGGVFGRLYVQVLIGILVGGVLGYLDPKLGTELKPLGDAFVKLIRMLLAPIIFGTVVVGIAWYQEPASLPRLLLILGVVACIAGLKITGAR